MREAARGLAMRAMLRIGENRLDEAWADLLAIHRLARLQAQGHTLVEQMVAMSISDMACRGTQVLLSSGHLTIVSRIKLKRSIGIAAASTMCITL